MIKRENFRDGLAQQCLHLPKRQELLQFGVIQIKNFHLFHCKDYPFVAYIISKISTKVQISLGLQ